MNVEHWLSVATAEIRFPPDQKAVRRELEGHLEDKKAAYLEQGCTLFEAETAATEDMGDPEELAKELGRIHRPWWGYIWRASKVLLILAIIMTVTELWMNRAFFQFLSRPELPEGETYTTEYGLERTVLERWRPAGAKKLGSYRFTSPMAWLEQGETDGETWYQLLVCLRADTWRFWEPCSAAPMMVLDNVISDSRGEEYGWGENERYRKGCSCEIWQEPFTTWYLVYLYDVGPEAVPEWVEIPVGYGGAAVRVDLEREVVS